MKNYIPFVTIVVLFLISCESNSKSNSKSNSESDSNLQRFSKKLDTTYKDNSTDIKEISRTFYEFIDSSSDEQILLATNNKDERISIICREKENFQFSHFENHSQFFKFLTDARTVLNNPTKKLKYDFGEPYCNHISTGIKKGFVFLFMDYFSMNESILFSVNSAEFDSMENCFNRFLKERK